MIENTNSKIVFKEDLLQFLNEKKESGWAINNILILTSSFLNYEGASKVVENQYLTISKAFKVTVFTFASNYKKSDFDFHIVGSAFSKNNICNIVYRASFFLNFFQQLQLLMKMKKYDVIIVHQGTWVTLAYLSKVILSKKTIFFNHHVTNVPINVTSNVNHSNNKVDFLMRLYEKILWDSLYWRLIKKFDYVISVSIFSKNTLFSTKGINSIIIYNKIDARFVKGLDGTIIRNKYGFKQNPIILFVGRIVPYKGIDKLIDAFFLVKNEIPNAVLIVIGKHYDRSYSTQLLDRSQGSVVFEQNISDDDLPYYYAACNVYATCSVIEGFNLPLVEAQECGKPVVAFDIGPHREVVKNGYLIKENNINEFSKKLVYILNNRV